MTVVNFLGVNWTTVQFPFFPLDALAPIHCDNFMQNWATTNADPSFLGGDKLGMPSRVQVTIVRLGAVLSLLLISRRRYVIVCGKEGAAVPCFILA